MKQVILLYMIQKSRQPLLFKDLNFPASLIQAFQRENFLVNKYLVQFYFLCIKGLCTLAKFAGKNIGDFEMQYYLRIISICAVLPKVAKASISNDSCDAVASIFALKIHQMNYSLMEAMVSIKKCVFFGETRKPLHKGKAQYS